MGIILIEYGILELFGEGIIENKVCSYIINYFSLYTHIINYVEKVKDIEYAEESEDVPNSGFRIDNGSINESEMSILFSGSTSVRQLR